MNNEEFQLSQFVNQKRINKEKNINNMQSVTIYKPVIHMNLTNDEQEILSYILQYLGDGKAFYKPKREIAKTLGISLKHVGRCYKDLSKKRLVRYGVNLPGKPYFNKNIPRGIKIIYDYNYSKIINNKFKKGSVENG